LQGIRPARPEQNPSSDRVADWTAGDLGPGGGTEPKHRRFLDPTAYRIVLFDQRGLRQEHAACEPDRQHHLAPGRRHVHRAFPEADLRRVADAGHASFEPGILHELVEATDRFRAT
jgi:hypothetical protein